MSIRSNDRLCWNCKSLLLSDTSQLSLASLEGESVESNILDSVLFHHALLGNACLDGPSLEGPSLEDPSIGGSLAGFSAFDLDAAEALALDRPASPQQVMDLSRAPPSDFLSRAWSCCESFWQPVSTSADQPSPLPSQRSDDTVLSLFSCPSSSDGPEGEDQLTTAWIDRFIAECQIRFPRLKREMDAVKRRQRVTLENEFIVYASFKYRKEYRKVAEVFSSRFGTIRTSSVRMRFRRMINKHGNAGLLNLANQILCDRTYTRKKAAPQKLLWYI